jgi:L-fucose isomerase-like protein
MPITIRLGFVPSYRNVWKPWTAEMREQSLTALASISGVQVVAPCGLTPQDAVQNLDQAEAVAEYFAQQKVDALVICPLDFGDERSAAKIAEKLRVPVLLYATKEPPASQDASLARVSDSYCGNLSVASALYRREIPFRFAGIFLPGEPELAAELETFVRAVAVVKGLRNARLGQVGVRPAPFETVAYNEAELARKFGQNVIFANLDDIVHAARQLPDDDPRVQEVVASIRSSVRTITVTDDHLLNSARIEVALADFWQRNRLSAMAVQCWPTIQRAMSLSLCAVFGRLTQRHLLTACEADILGALSMLVNYQAALGETLPHFIDWTIQHRDDPSLLLAWHCGNAPPCLARDPDQTALRSRKDMTGELPPVEGDAMAGLCQFQLRPGIVTFCRLAEHRGEWKMLIARGEIIPSNETLAGTWAWVRVPDHDRLYRTLVEEGFIHHASMIHGDQLSALQEACRFLDVRPVVVV